jgi:L-aminopeptidase/D-esterase-like protein
MTGTTWVKESGRLDTPILITNTHSVGVVRDATFAWMTRHRAGFLWALPVVAETYDGVLNDAEGFHVRPEHAMAALDGARSGPVREGNVGGGTGMVCHRFKGGTGTASRVVDSTGAGIRSECWSSATTANGGGSRSPAYRSDRRSPISSPATRDASRPRVPGPARSSPARTRAGARRSVPCR